MSKSSDKPGAKDEKPRRSLRFRPDPLTVALIDFKVSKNFDPQMVGLVVNESFSGCAVVLITDLPIKKGAKLKIKVGELGVLKAKLAWIKPLEENILKVGVNFTE